MSERQRILAFSSLIITAISLLVGALKMLILYEAAFEGQRERLIEIAQSQACLLDAIAASNPDPDAALQIMRRAHEKLKGIGQTGEFSLARLEDNNIVFLLHRRHAALADLKPVPFAAGQHMPIGQALSGHPGTMIGRDYRGERVLAAYEPVAGLQWGVVAKIDVREIRAPFVRAGMIAGGGALAAILCGVLLLLRVNNPLIRRLEESEARTKAILDTAPDGILTFDTQGRIESCNPAATRLFGYQDGGGIGQPIRRLIPTFASSAPGNGAITGPRLDARTALHGVHEATGQHQDGTTFPIDVAISEVCLGERRLFTAIARDSSERQRLEAHLRQSQKMEAIGTLAGGVAHDFNNILTAMLGFTELATYDTPRHTPGWSYLQEVLAAGKRAKDLVLQILAFSRQTETTRQPVQLAVLIKETLLLLRASLPSTIEIQPHIAPEVGTVLADPTQMHQILMNLCANAEHAMRQTGGRLEVSLDTVMLDATSAALLPELSPGPYMRLIVRDTGHGMTPAVLEHIFEPFFTTKASGEGTGMGLAVVHGIVTRHGGAITVDSALGQGTTFTIYLPRIADSVPQAAHTSGAASQGTGRLLVVDDEAVLARLSETMLRRLGYEVEVYTDSRAALEAFQAAPQTFDLVITDQTMPQMTGEQLAQALRHIRPDIPLILCTGFSHTVSADTAAALGVDAFLTKPLLTDDLAVAIARVLQQRRANVT